MRLAHGSSLLRRTVPETSVTSKQSKYALPIKYTVVSNSQQDKYLVQIIILHNLKNDENNKWECDTFYIKVF